MFSKIIYINLDRRTDRQKNVINQLNKIGLDDSIKIERISGIDWKTLDFNNISTDLITNDAINTSLNNNMPLYTYMTKGAIGCALAHRNAYLSVLNSDAEYVLILEDDIVIVDDFLYKLKLYLENIPKYDILWLGYHHSSTNNMYINNYCHSTGNFLYGLFGYIINKKAALKLLKIFPLSKQIDSEIPNIFSSLNVYSLNSDKILIHSMESSTETEYGTDIQIREDFSLLTNRNSYKYYIIILLIFLIYLINLRQ